MKRRTTFIPLSVIAVTAFSCSFTPYPVNSSASSEKTSQNPVSTSFSDTPQSSTSSSSEILDSSPISSSGSSSSKKETVSKTIDSSYRHLLSGSYSRTNNGSFYDEDYVGYSYYMVEESNNVPSEDLALLCRTYSDDSDMAGVEGNPGQIGNITPIDGLESLTVEYMAPSGGSITFYTRTGRDSSSYTYQIPESMTYRSFNVDDLEGRYSYFKIKSSLDGDLNLRSFTYERDPSINLYGDFDYDAKEDYSIDETIVYEPEEGEKALVPNVIAKNGDEYMVISYKEYTYYSFSYISSHTELAESVAYTSALDIAAYFMAFSSFPANVYGGSGAYGMGDSYSVKELFGSKARQCSRYNRTSGYVNAVDWNREKGDGYYYEVDIALAPSYPSPRGVGRLVVFSGGMNGYESRSTSFFTDDHYQTFQEYLGYGRFGDRFNAQQYGSSVYKQSFVNGKTYAPANKLHRE